MGRGNNMNTRPRWYDHTRELATWMYLKQKKEFLKLNLDSFGYQMRNQSYWFQRKDGVYDLVTYEQYIKRTQKAIETGEIK